MKQHMIIDFIIMFILITAVGLCLMSFMNRFENKKYFSAGTYLAGIVAFCSMLVNFIVKLINNN